MIRNIIRYAVLTLVVIGIVLLMGSLVNGDSVKFNSNNKKESNNVDYYSVSVKVLDRETKQFIKGGTFILKNSDNKVISEWENKENIKTVTKLTNGTYTIEQQSNIDGYEKSDKITFKIYNSNKDVVVYNEKTKVITSSNEVGVDNTLSTKSIYSYIIAIISIGYGLVLVNKKVKLQ